MFKKRTPRPLETVTNSQMLPTPESKLCQLHLCLDTVPASKVFDEVSWPVEATVKCFIHSLLRAETNPLLEPHTKMVSAKSLDSKNIAWKHCTLGHLVSLCFYQEVF